MENSIVPRQMSLGFFRQASFAMLLLPGFILPGLISPTLSAQVLITEFSATPVSEPEWIELINTSNRSISLNKWKLCDSRSCIELDKLSIAAHSTIVLTRDAEGLRESRSVPSNVDVIELTLPSLNNTTDRIELRDDDSVVVDTLSYNMKDFVKGRSVERYGVCSGTSSGGDSENAADECITWTNDFQTSVAIDSATCGRFNSVVKLASDLRVAAIRILDASIAVDVVNYGLRSMSSARIELNADEIRVDSTSNENRNEVARLSTQSPVLEPDEQFTWEISLTDIGGYSSVSTVELTATAKVNDDRNSNDKLIRRVMYPPPAGQISITEIMFDPWPQFKDYLEMYNGTMENVKLSGWRVEDGSGDVGVISSISEVAPGSYIAISANDEVNSMIDSGVAAVFKPEVNWNVEGDKVVLRTPDGFLVDQFSYDKHWHNSRVETTKGVSLEKLDPLMVGAHKDSWTSSGSLSGGTPGRKNSVNLELKTDNSELSAVPNPFSSDKTHVLNPSIIAFKQPFRHAIASLNIYTTRGVLVRQLLNAVFCGSEGAVAWDGSNDQGARVQVGPYVAVFESVDAGSSNVTKGTCVVIVGE